MTTSPSWKSDPLANRAATKYSSADQVRRFAWAFGEWLLRLSPRPCFAWRRQVLRMFGARVGADVNVYPTTRFTMPWNVELQDACGLGEDVYVYALGPVVIGRRATVSYRAHLCAGTHDLNDPAMPLLKPAVRLEADAWIGTEAFIGPGVTIGEGAVVGARAVVVRNVAPLCIVAGNPARPIGTRRITGAAAYSTPTA